MALNGISTLLPKSDRQMAKLILAQTKRQAVGTLGYRPLNVINLVKPNPTYPWTT